MLKRKGALMALAGSGFIAIVILSLPLDYVRYGRLGSVFWHRVVISLGANPEWPFGDLREMFDCRRYIPEGLVPGMPDRNGHCIWVDYAIRHDISADQFARETYDRRYEGAMREAFFKIARLYPGEVLAAFFYYKPKLILRSIDLSMQLNVSAYSSPMIALLIAAMINLCAYFIAAADLPVSKRMLIAGGSLLFGILTIPEYLVAWAGPHTIGDLLLFCLFWIGLLSGVMVASGARATTRLRHRYSGSLRLRAAP